MKSLTLDRAKQTQISSKNKQRAVNDIPEDELLIRYRNGDEDAFCALVNRYKNSLYTFLRGCIDNPELVKHVFQETFLHLYISRDSFDTNYPLRPWLFTTAVSKTKDAAMSIHPKHGTPADAGDVSADKSLLSPEMKRG